MVLLSALINRSQGEQDESLFSDSNLTRGRREVTCIVAGNKVSYSLCLSGRCSCLLMAFMQLRVLIGRNGTEGEVVSSAQFILHTKPESVSS